MDVQKILSDAAAIAGPSGQEMQIAAYFQELFRPYVDEVYIDKVYNVIAHKKGTGPKVMLCAHMDEIGLMVSRIEEDGSIRLGQVGGVDPRILPASRVWVYGREKLFGMVGAKPPHLTPMAERENNYKREDLYVDVGLPAEKVKELVRIGDIVTFNQPSTALLNGQFACKTMDDRACVTILLLAAERLQRMVCDADVYFVATTQEEVGSIGAKCAAFALDPDLAIALDVTHATLPGSRPNTTSDLGCLDVTMGPYIQPKLLKRLMDCAAAHKITLQTSVASRYTYTDADNVILSRAGVPTVLLSLPMKYMHTSVETIDTNVLEEGGRLIAHFLNELDNGWGEDLWI